MTHLWTNLRPRKRQRDRLLRWRSSSLFQCLLVLVAAWALLVGPAQAQMENPERTPIPPGPYRIAGTIVNAKAGVPLARARVTIADAKKRQNVLSVITGENGHFEFQVPAGKYSLDGAKRGFIEASYNQHDQYSTAIVTGAGLDTENLVLRLKPNAVLSGQVLDEFQEPVRDAEIMVYRENHFQGVSRIDRYRGAMTDDQGRYEVTPLDEGTYFVSAKATPWYAIHPSANSDGPPAEVDPALDVVYPITYYGDATETEGAVPIPVRGGDRLEADIHLSPAPSLHLTFHVPDEGSRGFSFMLRKPSFDGLEQVENGRFQMISPGVFELSGVPAGRYTVEFPDSNGAARESTEVDLSGGGELDMSAGSATSTVKVAVQVSGTTNIPAQLQLGLRNSKGRVEFMPTDDKGEVTFSDVTPGKYDLVAGSRAQAYSVTRVALETGTVAGHALNVPAGATLSVAVLLVGGSDTVEGFAKRDGKGEAGVMIVLVPKDPEANHDRFRRDQSDLDGSFALQNVIPGTYTIVAIEDGWDLDWSEPAVIARYLARGQTVEAADRAGTVQLADAVEVQTK